MKETSIIFNILWDERSISCDTPYKQWIKTGFEWANDLYCTKNEVNRILDRVCFDFSKLAERYNEIIGILSKRDSKISWLEKHIDDLENGIKDLIEDIEVAHNMGNKIVNPNWKSLNSLKDIIHERI